jgi:hypothetical protein
MWYNRGEYHTFESLAWKNEVLHTWNSSDNEENKLSGGIYVLNFIVGEVKRTRLI